MGVLELLVQWMGAKQLAYRCCTQVASISLWTKQENCCTKVVASMALDVSDLWFCCRWMMDWVVHSQILTVAQTPPTLLKCWPLVVATRSSCVPSHPGGEAHGRLRDSSGPRPHLLVHPVE